MVRAAGEIFVAFFAVLYISSQLGKKYLGEGGQTENYTPLGKI